MIMVNVSGSERQMDEVDGSWIHQQIDRRHHDYQPVWVLVRIRTDDLDMILCTGKNPRP